MAGRWPRSSQPQPPTAPRSRTSGVSPRGVVTVRPTAHDGDSEKTSSLRGFERWLALEEMAVFQAQDRADRAEKFDKLAAARQQPMR